jgi:glycosyltransferase involved in cell wall biosynthesis
MKIAHLLLTHSFAGTERYVVELANAQALAGHHVTVILHQRAAQHRPNAIAHRFNEHVQIVTVGGWGFLSFWTARRALMQLHGQAQVDVAHAHLSAGCRALKGLKVSFLRVATLHIRYKPQQHQHMDALIAIAPWQLKEVPAAQIARTQQINNWTQAKPATPSARQKLRAQWGIADDEFLVGALCRAEASKGLDVLINAYVAAHAPHTRLALVGGGRDWDALRQLAPPDVLMPGFVEKPEDWFSAFDAYVSAARSEPFGLVFLEAFAAGLPVVATASEGAQMFQTLIARPLVPCNDVAAMTQALQNLAQERPPKLLYNLSGYDCPTQVKRIEDFYTEELATNSQHR